MSLNTSVPGSLPCSSVPGLMEFNSSFANEILTCKPKMLSSMLQFSLVLITHFSQFKKNKVEKRV